MPSNPILPSIKARLRRRQVDGLTSALKIIVCERASDHLNGHTKNEGYWRVLPDRRPAGARFDPELMNRTIELWSRLCTFKEKQARSCRFALNSVELWLLALAIKMARHQERHRPTPKKFRGESKKWSRLLGNLRRLQRKARRAWLGSEQAPLFEFYRARWEGFQIWLEMSYGCLCKYPAIARTHQRRRQFFARGVEVAKTALAEADFYPPDQEQLRYLVKLAFAEIRRGRQPISIGEILKGDQRARFFLAYFIRERLRKSGQLKFIDSQ